MSDVEDRELTAAEQERLAGLPLGAAFVCGIAVALMLLVWFLIWLLIYLPRGSIG